MSRNAAAIEKAACDGGAFNSAAAGGPATAGHHRAAVYSELIGRLFDPVQPGRIVAFTSALPGEGVTYTVKRLAAELEASMGWQVAVVTAAELFPGRPASILGPVRPPAGPEDRVLRLLELRSECGAVLVDAGSVAGGGGVAGFGRSVNSVVLVVEAGRTRKKEIDHAIAAVEAAHGHLAGIVFNKHRRWIPAWLEGYLT